MRAAVGKGTAAGLGVVLWTVVACAPAPPATGPAEPVVAGACSGAGVDAEWDRLLAPYLGDDLWRSGYAYDAGHLLQVPLHAAFALGRRDWQQDFAEHFRRYVDSGPERIDNPLYRFQYLYLASRFVVLAQTHGREELVPDRLPSSLLAELRRVWRIEPARHWSRDTERAGRPMAELLAWKLRAREVEPGHLRAIRDEELFVLTVAADLQRYRRSTGETGPDAELLAEIVATADRVFSQEVRDAADGPGWLLQPGVWSSHRDYLFAGHDEIGPDLEPAPVPGLSMDSAHRHRLPLWLVSLAGAHRDDTAAHAHYLRLWDRLEAHFMEVVLVPPSPDFPGYRLNNYMDGRNGLYRYGYQTLGDDGGYGPYGRSGKLGLAWWRLLPGRRAHRLYRDLCAQYPLPAQVRRLYAGPGTSRSRHRIVEDAEPGLRELLVSLAARLTPGSVAELPG